MRAEAGAAVPGGLTKRIIHKLVGDGTIAIVMALQANSAVAGVGHDGAIGHGYGAQDAQQVRVIGGHGLAVRFVASLATDRAVGGISGRAALDAADETAGGVATYALAAGWT